MHFARYGSRFECQLRSYTSADLQAGSHHLAPLLLSSSGSLWLISPFYPSVFQPSRTVSHHLRFHRHYRFGYVIHIERNRNRSSLMKWHFPPTIFRCPVIHTGAHLVNAVNCSLYYNHRWIEVNIAESPGQDPLQLVFFTRNSIQSFFLNIITFVTLNPECKKKGAFY